MTICSKFALNFGAFDYELILSLDDEEQQRKDNWMANYTGDPKDRTRIIPLEKSLAYMESEAYRQTYGNHRVTRDNFM